MVFTCNYHKLRTMSTQMHLVEKISRLTVLTNVTKFFILCMKLFHTTCIFFFCILFSAIKVLKVLV